MSYDAQFFAEVLTLKGLTRASGTTGSTRKIDNSEVARRTQLRPEEIYHYLKGRVPQKGMAKLVGGLEVTSDFLSGIGVRFKGVPTQTAVAHMALDRYLETRTVPKKEAETLRDIAERHPNPPVWAAEWEQHHTSVNLSRTQPPREPTAPRPRRVEGRLVGTGLAPLGE